MKRIIEKLLTQKLSALHLEVVDDSAAHQGHREAIKSGGGHFSVLIVSEQFAGKNLLARHRLVYSALKEHLKEKIHALAIKAYTPEEYKKV